VTRASHVLALTGSDACNAEIATLVRRLAARSGAHGVKCFAHILDLDLCRFLREREVESVSGPEIKVEFFCIHETGARVLLSKFGFLEAMPAAEAPPPHIVIVGPGRFGASLIVQAAREWRNAGGNAAHKLRITIVDHSGATRLERLRARFPQIDSVCEFELVSLHTLSPEFSKAAFLFDLNGKCTVSTVYIGLDDESAGLTAAFTLNRCLERRGVSVPIVVRMSEGSGFAAMFSDRAAGASTNIRAFHLLDETCMPAKLCVSTNELVAQALHNQYLASVRGVDGSLPPGPAVVEWDKLPEPLRESNRQQALHLSQRLHHCGYQIIPLSDWEAENFVFADAEVEQMARMEHERWCAEKKQAGMTYAAGPRTKTTHPNLLPWDQLDDEAQEKTRAIVRSAPRVLASVGFQVEKPAHSRSGLAQT
jgi:hypothetical protein